MTGLLPSGDLVRQGGGVGDAPIQALAAEEAQFDFGPVEPASVFWGVMNLHAFK